VDTAALLALSNADDDLNAAAVAVRNDIAQQGVRMVTTDAVLTETASGLSGARVRHLAAPVIDAVRASAYFDVVHVDLNLWERGWVLFKARHDKEWSLVDCLSFVVMQDRGIIEAFTSDHHYQQAGFVCLLPARR
jgi:hypothetical protein